MSATGDLTDRIAGVASSPEPSSRAVTWAGRGMTGLAVLFLLMDAGMKLLEAAPAMETTTGLGYPAHVVFWLGVLQAVLLVLYLVPATSVLGAVLWTGYLGGAVATHVRVESPLLTHTLFPVFIAGLLWGGLWLRDRRLRALLPLG